MGGSLSDYGELLKHSTPDQLALQEGSLVDIFEETVDEIGSFDDVDQIKPLRPHRAPVR
jgi:hypothetical protein